MKQQIFIIVKKFNENLGNLMSKEEEGNLRRIGLGMDQASKLNDNVKKAVSKLKTGFTITNDEGFEQRVM